MPRALLSVSDKTGLIPFARALAEQGWSLLSTGGTAAALRDAGLQVEQVGQLTGVGEILGGRVKTLHPAVHGGLLARAEHPGDAEQMAERGLVLIDLVAVNLYPFRETVARPDVTDEDAIEQIDIGGPAMLRSAAKNHARVWAVVDPADYPGVVALATGPEGEAARAERRRLAQKVFAHTSAYDAAIAGFLDPAPALGTAEASLPPELVLRLSKAQDLRYGENPDQRAAWYLPSGAPLPFEQLAGKDLSYNNLLDVDAARLAAGLWRADEAICCAIMKHTTPCGIGVGGTAAEAYARALATDPTSAFGSVIGFNVAVDAAAAERLRDLFVEAIVAPEFTPDARALLAGKKNLRLLRWVGSAERRLDLRGAAGGFLAQQPIPPEWNEAGWTVPTRRRPTEAEWQDLRFAWRAVAAVKSNAILLARDGAAIGIGAGQMSRVDSVRLALQKAADTGAEPIGAVLASDAFFPFRDGLDAAAAAGVSAVIQPGGSVRDPEVVAAADQNGVAMVLTGRRLFRH